MSHTAHYYLVERFAELYTLFEERREYWHCSTVLHYCSIIGIQYDVWRLVTTGLHPGEERVETWAFVNAENCDSF
jgi:hypothetical protein